VPVRYVLIPVRDRALGLSVSVDLGALSQVFERTIRCEAL